MALTDIVNYDSSPGIQEESRGNIGAVTEIINCCYNIFEIPAIVNTAQPVEVSYVF